MASRMIAITTVPLDVWKPANQDREVIIDFEKDGPDDNSNVLNANGFPPDPEFTVCPFYDSMEKNSEIVNINFANWDFNYEFLEPLAAKLSKTIIQWSISREEKQFQLSLYF